MTAPPDTPARLGLAWWAGLVVASGAGVATAHGLYEVAHAARVPFLIACIYPLITDGLALVAYLATAKLKSKTGCGYAWTVVAVAAGLSGLMQAIYLAGGVPGQAPSYLRFGVGAWPAIVAAVTFHLLFLLGRAKHGSPIVPKAAKDTPVVSHALGVPQRLTDVPERVTEGQSPVVERPRVTAPAEPRHAAKGATKPLTWAQKADAGLRIPAEPQAILDTEEGGPRIGVRSIEALCSVSNPKARDLRAQADDLAGQLQTDLERLMASSVPIHHANGSN